MTRPLLAALRWLSAPARALGRASGRVLRWLAVYVRGFIALAAIVVAFAAPAALTYVVVEERRDRDVVLQELIDAAEVRERLAVERAESAEERAERLAEIAAELVAEARRERTAEHADIIELLESLGAEP